MNIYNNSKQASTNNVLPMEINIILRINTSSSQLIEEKVPTSIPFQIFSEKIVNVWFLVCLISSYLAIQEGPN